MEIYLQNETIWLSQQKIADLFGVQRPAVSKHLKSIFEGGELQEDVVCSILEHATFERWRIQEMMRGFRQFPTPRQTIH